MALDYSELCVFVYRIRNAYSLSVRISLSLSLKEEEICGNTKIVIEHSLYYYEIIYFSLVEDYMKRERHFKSTF